MEEFVNFALWGFAFVGLAIPACGLGLAPGIVVNLEVVAIAGTLYGQIVDKGILKLFIKDNADNKILKPLIPAIENVQKTIDSIEDGTFGKKPVEEKHDEHAHHIIPIPVYLGVLAILLVGTVITVAVAQVDFGAWNTVIAMLVATVKASFVLAYFMHLKYDNLLNRVIFGSGFFFLMILISFSLIDIITRVKPILGFKF